MYSLHSIHSWFPSCLFLLSLQESISPCCSPDYITKKGRIPLLKSSLFFYISEHSVHSLIFVKHLRMILLFHLDICQKLPHTTVFKSKNLRVVFSGNQLFCSDTVCCKETVRFLILGRCHAVGSSRVIIFSITVVAVAGRNFSRQLI